MQKWEYKVIDGWPSESKLNMLGAEGWELVSVATVGGDYRSGDKICVYLKRLISN